MTAPLWANDKTGKRCDGKGCLCSRQREASPVPGLHPGLDPEQKVEALAHPRVLRKVGHHPFQLHPQDLQQMGQRWLVIG